MATGALQRGGCSPEPISQQPTHLGSMWPVVSAFPRTCSSSLPKGCRNNLIWGPFWWSPHLKNGNAVHSSLKGFNSVVGKSPKDEKSKRFHCLIQVSITANTLLTHPTEPTLSLPLVLSTTEKSCPLQTQSGLSLPRSGTLDSFLCL